jgi:hypothetical protein
MGACVVMHFGQQALILRIGWILTVTLGYGAGGHVVRWPGAVPTIAPWQMPLSKFFLGRADFPERI